MRNCRVYPQPLVSPGIKCNVPSKRNWHFNSLSEPQSCKATHGESYQLHPTFALGHVSSVNSFMVEMSGKSLESSERHLFWNLSWSNEF